MNAYWIEIRRKRDVNDDFVIFTSAAGRGEVLFTQMGGADVYVCMYICIAEVAVN